MNYTPNYQLPQWEQTDRVIMDDFNNAMSTIEEGLSAKCEMYFGTYTGTGTYGENNPTVLHLGFQPRMVFLLGPATNGSDHMVMINPCKGAMSYDGNYTGCTITWLEDGVQWVSGYFEGTQFNRLNQTYYYVAFR